MICSRMTSCAHFSSAHGPSQHEGDCWKLKSSPIRDAVLKPLSEGVDLYRDSLNWTPAMHGLAQPPTCQLRTLWPLLR